MTRTGSTLRPAAVACAALLALFSCGALLPGRAHALDAALATECIACEHPAVVSVGAQCTGIYMGHGLILTAAHCMDDVRPGKSRVFFGEDIAEPAHAAVLTRCERHPDGAFARNALGEDTYEGVDLAFCLLDDTQQPLPDVPLVPPLVPTGCERDWLAQQVTGGTAVLTAVGFGCAQSDEGGGETCDAGVKRRVAVQLVAQIDRTGSPTKLELQRGGSADTALMAGDSGGPYLARLPDGGWRLIALHHGADGAVSGAFAESVAPYVHWIESASGVDVTPCHDFVDGEWIASDACPPGTPLGASEVGGAWSSSCRSGVLDAAYVASSAVCPQSDDAAGLVASDADLDAAVQRVLQAPPARRPARLATELAALEPRAFFPFLETELPGTAPLASLGERVRRAENDERAEQDEDAVEPTAEEGAF